MRALQVTSIILSCLILVVLCVGAVLVLWKGRWEHRFLNANRYVVSTRPDQPPPALGPLDFRCPGCQYECKGFRDRHEAEVKAREHFLEHMRSQH